MSVTLLSLLLNVFILYSCLHCGKSEGALYLTHKAMLLDDFLTHEECARLDLSFQNKLMKGGNYAHHENQMLKNTMDAVGLLTYQEVNQFARGMSLSDRMLMLQTLRRMRMTVRSTWNDHRPTLAFDHAEFQVKGPGYLHHVHSDQCGISHDGSGTRSCVEHANHCCRWRHVTAFLYLSDSGDQFEGGELEFPEWKNGWVAKDLPTGVIAQCTSNETGVCVQPRCGRLVTFLSTGTANIHAVRNVTRGRRVAIGAWFTHSSEHGRQLPTNAYEQALEV